MGEFADYAIDDMLAYDEAIMAGHIDDPDDWSPFYNIRRRQFKVCKVCGQSGLRWGIHEDHWALENRDGSRHVCKFKGFIRA